MSIEQQARYSHEWFRVYDDEIQMSPALLSTQLQILGAVADSQPRMPEKLLSV
jgi:hypothetical protein